MPTSAPTPASHRRASGILLIAGWIIFWSGAPAWRLWAGAPLEKFLQILAANLGEWYWSAGAFAVGVALTLAGLVILRSVLVEAGDRVWSDLGQSAFLFGSLMWMASLAFRATATVVAAKASVDSGVTPAWFVGMWSWAGAIFAIYMVLAYLAIAAYGKALLNTEIAPRWLGRTCVVFGLAGAVGFIARLPPFYLPLTVHLVPGILGIVLVVRASRGRST